MCEDLEQRCLAQNMRINNPHRSPKDRKLKIVHRHTFTLISHANIYILQSILKRIESKLEYEFQKTQAFFKQCRITKDYIFNIRIIFEKCKSAM